MTYQEYLKDKDGNIFSPITSSDSVYYKEFTGGGNYSATQVFNSLNTTRSLFIHGTKGFDIVIDDFGFDKYSIEVTIVHNYNAKISKQILSVNVNRVISNIIVADSSIPTSSYQFTFEFLKNYCPKIHFNTEQYSTVEARTMTTMKWYLVDTEIGNKSYF